MVSPPASTAPRLADAITPCPPPVSTTQPHRAAAAPTCSATNSSSGVATLPPKTPRTCIRIDCMLKALSHFPVAWRNRRSDRRVVAGAHSTRWRLISVGRWSGPEGGIGSARRSVLVRRPSESPPGGRLPSVAPSAACLVAGRGAPDRLTARVARHRHCATRVELPGGSAGTMPCPARPGERQWPAGPSQETSNEQRAKKSPGRSPGLSLL